MDGLKLEGLAQTSAAADQIEKKHHRGNDQQGMDQTAADIQGEAQKPQHQ